MTPDSPRPPRTIIELELMFTELAKALFLEQDKVFQASGSVCPTKYAQSSERDESYEDSLLKILSIKVKIESSRQV